jgi:hypothetical protein
MVKASDNLAWAESVGIYPPNASNASRGTWDWPYKLGLIHEDLSDRVHAFKDLLDCDVAELPQPSGEFVYGLKAPCHMACNDTIGDCTLAGFVNGAEISATISGIPYKYPGDNAVKAEYYKLTGGPDSGLYLSQVISAASVPGGILGMEIAGFALVDNTNLAELRTVAYNFGWLYLAINCPASAMNDFNAVPKRPWTELNPPDQNILGGHCIISNGDKFVQTDNSMGSAPLDIRTWEAQTEMSWDFFKYYGVQAYVLVPQTYLVAGHDATSHLNKAIMQADLASLAS